MRYQIKEVMMRLLAEVASDLPVVGVSNIEGLIAAGEEGIALEILLDSIDEFEINVSNAFMSDSARMAEMMELHMTPRWIEFTRRHRQL